MVTKGAILAALASGAFAHHAVWHPGMYCRGGNDTTKNDSNTNLVVNPLWNLPRSQWWMQADRGCDVVPPTNGDSLALPAGGSFEVEIAENRAFTTLSYDGRLTTDWTDGRNRSDDWHGPLTGEGCLIENPDGLGGPLHTQSEERATGTAFAISYHANIRDVNMENLVVFSVLKNTPWKRRASYDVPAGLPPCPSGGCYCAWLWVPDGCGQPNMYMQNFKCHVTGSTSKTFPGKAKPPVYCADDPTKCVKGPKQMIVWHQASGDNVITPGDITPPYNSKMGFLPGAQNDIFEDSIPPSPSTPSESTTTPHPTTTPATPSPSPSPKLGCYKDTGTPRTLPTSIQIPDDLTPEKCIAACSGAGLKFAGVEYMSECWCGDSAPDESLKVDDSECNLKCTGSDQTCGAAWLIDVYETGV